MSTQRPRRDFKNHDLADDILKPGVKYEKRPSRMSDGGVVAGLFNAWVTLDGPNLRYSYTTDMVKGVTIAMRDAANARDVVCVVCAVAGGKNFYTRGNTRGYASHPQEYGHGLRFLGGARSFAPPDAFQTTTADKISLSMTA